jgi:hypothetical protein
LVAVLEQREPGSQVADDESLIYRKVRLQGIQKYSVAAFPAQDVFENGKYHEAGWKKTDQGGSRQSKAERVCFGLQDQVPEQRKQIPDLPYEPVPKIVFEHPFQFNPGATRVRWGKQAARAAYLPEALASGCSICNSFFTSKTPDTPEAAIYASWLSVWFSTMPFSTARPFFTMMWIGGTD